MHFAYPSRKKSIPPPFRPSQPSRVPPVRNDRSRILILILLALALCAYVFLGREKSDSYAEREPSGNPAVVIVTVTDPETHNGAFLNYIRENREQYAALYGYETFIARASDYEIDGAPRSWTKLMAIRHVLSKYPDCGHVWFLDEKALILSPMTSLEEQIVDQSKLAEIMLPETPVVPESIINTFGHLQAEDAALLISQDKSGLVTDSMIIKNGEWAKFLLEQLLDPLYRSYNFEKAERHALEHAVQWHPTILSKIALVPQRMLAAYTSDENGDAVHSGDFVVLFDGCLKQGSQGCAQELGKYWPRWNNALGASRS